MYAFDNIICTIPARSGSKRLPNKNTMILANKPMIAYSIEAAIHTQLFQDIYVCTDDPIIASIAQDYGAKVPFLMEPDLCGDLVASHIPCQEMASFLSKEGKVIDSMLCLQPTSPLRSVEDITKGVRKFFEEKLDFLVSVTPIDPHYFHWALQSNNEGFWEMFFGTTYMLERPLLPSVYRPNGSIKIAKLEKLKEVGNFFGKRLGVIETPEERSIHVATQFEFKFCEFLLNSQRS